MTDYEFKKEFEKINKKLNSLGNRGYGHFLIIILLIILVIRGC